MVPLDHAPMPHEPTRVFVYPFARTKESLAGIGRVDADPHFGHKLRYVNPATGRSPMPTIGTFAQRLPKGLRDRALPQQRRHRLRLPRRLRPRVVGDTAFDFGPRDIFVVPSWHTFTLEAKSEATLFSFSDWPVQQVLGLWREEKLG